MSNWKDPQRYIDIENIIQRPVLCVACC
jgi:hypothetical protein